MKKILVIQNKRIGDVLLASLIAENIKQVYPNAIVNYMVYDYTSGVIENHPAIDRIITLNEKKLKKVPHLIKTAFKVRKEKYDIIFDPYAKLQSRVISLLSGARVRVGYKKKDKKPLLNFYTHNINFLKKKSKPCGKSIEDRVNLVTSVFDVKKPVYRPKLYLTEDEMAYSKLEGYKKPIVMFGILGSTPQKSMPYEYIQTLIDHTIETFNVTALFNYAPNQKEEAQKIYDSCQHKDRIIFDIYENDIRGFAKLMNQCKLLIANEGGAVHIAKALGKPTFTIFSPYVVKEHWASFEDGRTHTSIHLLDIKPNLYSQNRSDRRKIEANPYSLYEQLSPEVILPKLDQFLKPHLN